MITSNCDFQHFPGTRNCTFSRDIDVPATYHSVTYYIGIILDNPVAFIIFITINLSYLLSDCNSSINRTSIVSEDI